MPKELCVSHIRSHTRLTQRALSTGVLLRGRFPPLSDRRISRTGTKLKSFRILPRPIET